jgi:hypothetical protein
MTNCFLLVIRIKNCLFCHAFTSYFYMFNYGMEDQVFGNLNATLIIKI